MSSRTLSEDITRGLELFIISFRANWQRKQAYEKQVGQNPRKALFRHRTRSPAPASEPFFSCGKLADNHLKFHEPTGAPLTKVVASAPVVIVPLVVSLPSNKLI
jgi:hypothetical protein